MAPKKKKEEKKQYQLVSSEEMENRLNIYQNRLHDLSNILKQINAVNKRYQNYLKNQIELDEWNFFIRCEGLPKAHEIPNIRLFVEKIRHCEQNEVLASMNWLLAVNERSILTQNIFQKDCTKPQFKQEIAPNFGKEYSNYIGSILKLIENMNAFLVNDLLTVNLSENSLFDIAEEKKSLYAEIRNIFDRYSYRVLCSETANCESIDPITAEYTYTDKNFQIHIWMLKNVPINFRALEDTSMKAHLNEIKVSVAIPIHVLKDNLVLRGIHYESDHFSEFAKSFSQTISMPFEIIPSLIPNLYACLESEWYLYLSVQDEIKADMVEKRLDYEEKLRAFEEAEAESGKVRNKEGEKRRKSVRIQRPQEVPLVEENMFPDVYDDFLKREQKLFHDFTDASYNPSNLKLTDDEINLKQYFMLGGTYELYFINKPDHLDYDNVKFNMTWHQNNGSVKIDKEFYITQDELRDSNRKSDISNKKARLSRISRSIGMSLISEAEIIKPLIYEDWKFFEIKFVLPDYLCEWEVPLVCHYEDNVETFGNDATTDSFVILNAHMGSIYTSKSRLTLQHSQDPDNISFNSNILKSSFSFKPTSSNEAIRRTIEDFSLKKQLQVDEVRKLERYVLPCMLSSYKFPDEIMEETLNTKETKAKEASSKKMERKKKEEKEDLLTTIIFNHKNQYNPERLFPIYDHYNNLQKHRYENDLEVEEPETFFDLIAMFNILKDYLSNSYYKILRVPSIKLQRKSRSQKKFYEILAKPSRSNRKSKAGRDSKRRKSRMTLDVTSEYSDGRSIMETKKLNVYSHWTTKYIHKSTFDRENHTMTAYTDRLG